MQGLIDEPLNETGIAQAYASREKLGGMKFDAVYASPLCRAIKTASIIADIPESDIIIDPRIIEADFGKYDKKIFYFLGPKMSRFWADPVNVPAPPTVESIPSMIERSHAFLKELESKDYNDVLVVCHGGIIRALKGYLEDNPDGVVWRPRPENCEINIYECVDGKHTKIKQIL